MTKIFTDGGSRGNPGNSACAFYIFDENDTLIDFGGEFLNIGTNNNAEYMGLLLGLKTCLKQNLKHLDCYLDSELIVNQLNGRYNVKDENMKKLFLEVADLRKQFEKITFTHVRREKNKYADKLVNLILDQH